jgi:protein TonB
MTNATLPAGPTVSGGASGGSSSGGGGSRRTEAVGVEIPVVVHASRNSASSRDYTKTLAPVHEETRTVIVFPQGAVIRLTAAVTSGELVVLSNQKSGADVLCRVVSVKAQPGIQNYVDLEFTQRAPGFWGDCFPADQSSTPIPAAPTAAAQSAIVAPTIVPATVPSAAGPAPSVASVTKLPPPPLAPAPQPLASAEPVVAPPVASPISGNTLGLGLARPKLIPDEQLSAHAEPQLGGEKPSSSSKRFTAIALAAAVVVMAIVIGFVLLRNSAFRASEAVPAAQGIPAAAPAAVSPVSTVPPADVAEPSAAVPASPSVPAASSEPPLIAHATEPSARPASPAVEAPLPKQPKQAQHKLEELNKISGPVVRRPVTSASMEAPAILPANANPAPFPGTLLPEGLAGSPIAPPEGPAAPTGGRVQEAKLVASNPPVYPATALTQRIEGDVVLEATLNIKGQVVGTKVISGPVLLQQAAINALRGWKFEPARLDGEPIETRTQVRISFHLP